MDLPLLAHKIETVKGAVNFGNYYSLPHVGDYKFSARTEDFHSWLKCDGRVLSVQQYPTLYEVIGTSFGDDGPNTFCLPDVRGRVPGSVGESSAATATNHVLGQNIGEERVQLQVSEMPSHNHTGLTGAAGYDTSVQSIAAVGGGSTTAEDNVNSHQHTIPSQGGDQAHQNMQPTLFIGSMFIFSGVQTGVNDPIVV